MNQQLTGSAQNTILQITTNMDKTSKIESQQKEQKLLQSI